MSTQSRGLSLVNVVVVILVLGLIVAMLLPAFQFGHSNSRRSSCSNNLKQLALAVHNYHDSQKALPVLYLQPEEEMSASWLVQLFPYLEQQNIYRNLEKNNLPANADEAKEVWVLDLRGNEQMINNFQSAGLVCDARRGPMLATYGKVTASPTDYCAVNSSNSCWFGTPDERRTANGCIVDPASAVQFYNNRVVPWKARTNFGSITDGLTYTAMFGEKHFYEDWKFGNTGRSADGQSAADGPAVLGGAVHNVALFHARRLGGLAASPTCTAPTTAVPLFAIDEGDGREAVHLQAFGSWHPGITLFAMADGSVQIVKNFNSPETLSALGGRNEGQPYELQ